MKHKSKFGLNSGNSFHFGTRRRALAGHGARHENLMFKIFHLPSQIAANNFTIRANLHQSVNEGLKHLEALASTMVPDGGISHEMVSNSWQLNWGDMGFSLNKHKRWLLPELMAECIDKLKQANTNDHCSMNKNETCQRQLKGRQKNNASSCDFEDRIRVTMFQRLIAPAPPHQFIGRRMRHGACALEADCIQYEDSAVINPTHVLAKKRTKYSFYSDLRLSALNKLSQKCWNSSRDGNNAQRFDDIPVFRNNLKQKQQRPGPGASRIHMRGIQRMSKINGLKRSITKQEQRLVHRINTDCGQPEIRYEICSSKPLMAHHSNDDYRHYDRFQWHYAYSHPKKSLKKMVGKSRPVKTDISLPMSSNELRYYIREMQCEDTIDPNWCCPANSDDESDLTSSKPDDDLAEYLHGASEYLMAEAFCDASVASEKHRASRRNWLSNDSSLKKKRMADDWQSCEVVKQRTQKASSNFTHHHGKGEAVYISIVDSNFTHHHDKGEEYDVSKYQLFDEPQFEAGFESLSYTTESSAEIDAVKSTADDSEYVDVDETQTDEQLNDDFTFILTTKCSSLNSLCTSSAYSAHCLTGLCIPRLVLVDLTRSSCDSVNLVYNLDPLKSFIASYKSGARLYFLVEELACLSCETNMCTSTGWCKLRCRVIGDGVNDICQEVYNSFNDVTVDSIVDVLDVVANLKNSTRFYVQDSELRSSVAVKQFLPSYHFISKAAGWSVDCLGPQQVLNKLASTRDFTQMPLFVSPATTYVAVKQLDHCEICFISLNTVNSSTSGLALMYCGHCFCKDCWRHYLTASVSHNKPVLQCPGFQCSTPVDLVSLISALSLHQFDRYLRVLADYHIESRPSCWQWCSNPRCQRILHRSSQTFGVLRSRPPIAAICHCGWLRCFQCGNTPHWPAACCQAEQYDRMRQQNGDDIRRAEPKVYFVDVKRCPNCYYPIEKNGGCPHMTCSRCLKQFCWICQRDWFTHDLLNCFDSGIQTLSIDHSNDVIMNIHFYHKAVEQRWKRTVWNCRKLSDKLFQRCHRLQRAIVIPDNWALLAGVNACQLNKFKEIAISLPVNSDTNEDVFEFLRVAAALYFDARLAIEYSYVHNMSCTKKQIPSSQTNMVELLEMVADRMEEVLFHSRGKRIENRLIHELFVRMKVCVQCIESLANMIYLPSP